MAIISWPIIAHAYFLVNKTLFEQSHNYSLTNCLWLENCGPQGWKYLLSGPLQKYANCCYMLCCAVLCLVAQLCLTLCVFMDCTGFHCPWQEFSRQEYWSRLPCPSPGHLPNPGIELSSPTLQVDSLPSKPPEKSDIYYWE